MKKYNQVRRIPRFETEKKVPILLSIWQFLVGTLLWIFFIVITGVTIYAHWFSQALINILRLFKEKNYYIPMWFSVVCMIFLFPLTLVVILASALIRIIKE